MGLELPWILLADDSVNDCKIIQMAMNRLDHPCGLKTVPDGEALMHALRSGDRPSFILLDLNLPLKSGFEALQEIKADPLLRAIPVVIWSTSENPADILRCYHWGASSFLTKLDSFEGIMQAMQALTLYWLRTTKLPMVPNFLP
jgi:CheY-like chemotaxis protein